MHFEAKDFGIIVFEDVAISKDFAFLIYFMLHAIIPDPAFAKAL